MNGVSKLLKGRKKNKSETKNMTLNYIDKTFTFQTGTSGCRRCYSALGYLNKISKSNPDCYAAKNLKTGKQIFGVVISPDFNASGHVTHWHIRPAKASD